MITIDDNSEFSYTIFDVIKTLNKLDKFVIKIWSTSSELAFVYDQSNDFHFLQEAIRVSADDRVNYIALDNIISIVIFEGKTLDEVWV